MSKQLTLRVALRDDATFDNFYPGDNAQPLFALQQFCRESAAAPIFLWGDAAVGRSHLLQACCHVFSGEQKTAAYLPLRDDLQLQPSVLEAIEQLDLVAIDDIDAVLGNAAWEEALFHFYNRAQAANTHVLMSANNPPAQLTATLPDLQSRLAWGLTLKIQPLSETDMVTALTLRAEQRGMRLPIEVAHYLLRHCQRNMKHLCQTLDQLDHASITEQRRLTVPFVKMVLNQHSR